MKSLLFLLIPLLLPACAAKQLTWTNATTIERTGAEFDRDRYQCESSHQVMTLASSGAIRYGVTPLFYDCMAHEGWILDQVPTGGLDLIVFTVGGPNHWFFTD